MKQTRNAKSASRSNPASLAGHIGAKTLVSSEARAWNDVFVEILTQSHIQHAVLVPATIEPVLSWTISGDAVVEEREIGGEWLSRTIQSGDFYLTHSSAPYEIRWDADQKTPFHAMHLYLSFPLLEKAAAAVFGLSSGKITLREVSGGRDPAISHLLSLLHQELTIERKGTALYVEGLLQSLAIHLVRHYGDRDHYVKGRDGLTRFKLRQATNYMSAHLDEAFDLAALAEEVGLSAFHFSRLFKKATGLAPSQYFIRLRAAKAQQLLRETDKSILEVGIAVGYSSPSHFAQMFRRHTGLSPSDYRAG
jgi:AraC family transcriptional regulator